jgi:hypothetical protein
MSKARLLDSRGLSGLTGCLMRTYLEGPGTGVRPSTSPWHPPCRRHSHTHTMSPQLQGMKGDGNQWWTGCNSIIVVIRHACV